MIRRIEITNFQSIGHAVLDLDAWTSIIGESDRGKSAIVRAVRAALTNQRGDWFIRDGASACEVTLTLDDGREVTWSKARGSGGVYVLADDAMRGTYEKTNGEVPEAIEDLLRISVDVQGEPVTPGIQMQHDAPFLLSDTPRRRAQIMGELDGTNIALQAEARVRSKQRADQRDVADAESRIVSLDADLTAYSALDDAVAAVDAYEAAREAVRVRTARVERLGDFRDRLRTGAEYEAKAQAVIGALRLAPRDAVSLDERFARREALHAATIRIGVAMHVLEQASRIRAALPAEPISPVAFEEAASRVERMRELSWRTRRAEYEVARAVSPFVAARMPSVDRADRLAELRTLVSGWQSARDEADDGGLAGARIERELIRARDDLESLAGLICPTCGQPLDARAALP